MTFSPRQYQMIKMFHEASAGISLHDMKRYDQRPFRSMLIRGWVTYNKRVGFAITKQGRHDFLTFLSQDISRKSPEMPLTAYFDQRLFHLKAKGARA
jgi:hypothetical protein